MKTQQDWVRMGLFKKVVGTWSNQATSKAQFKPHQHKLKGKIRLTRGGKCLRGGLTTYVHWGRRLNRDNERLVYRLWVCLMDGIGGYWTLTCLLIGFLLTGACVMERWVGERIAVVQHISNVDQVHISLVDWYCSCVTESCSSGYWILQSLYVTSIMSY